MLEGNESKLQFTFERDETMKNKKLRLGAIVLVGVLGAVLLSYVLYCQQERTIAEVLELQKRQEANIEYIVHMEGQPALQVRNGDALYDMIYDLFDSVAVTKRILPKRAIINGERIMVYIAAWDDGQSTERLPAIELIVENEVQYSANIGKSSFKVVSDTQVIDEFFTLISDQG